MANIKTFDTPSLGLQPSEAGYDARLQVGRRVGAFYGQVADSKAQTGQELGSDIKDVGAVVENYETNREISKGSADSANLIAQSNNDWNTFLKGGKLSDGTQVPAADPNDPTLADKFRQRLQQRLDDFSGNFTTARSQEWAEHLTDKYRQHMFEKTSADMSTLAGEAVKVNARQMVNGLASAAASDPSSLDFALDVVGHKIDGMVGTSPNLTGTQAAAVHADVLQTAKEGIVKAAISSMIQKNPNIDLDAIQQKYGDYINGAEMKMFQKTAQAQAKADFIQSKQIETYQRQQQDRAASDASTKSFTDNVKADSNGNLTINPKIVSDSLDIARQFPEAGAQHAKATIEFVQAQQNKEMKVVDDPVVKSDLMTRMFSADNPTTTIDLMKARAAGKISDHTFTAYHGLVQELEQSPMKGPIWHDTVDAVKGELVLSGVGLPGKDITGEGNYAKWAQTFIPQYQAKSRAGTLEPNALDIKDPNSFISKSMEPFKRTVGQRTQDYLSVLNGQSGSAPAARKVGDVAVPAALGGIADLQFNKQLNQWRDRSSGAVYDAAGKPVAR